MREQMKSLTFERALLKARKYCDKAERAHSDVRRKLSQWGVTYQDRERIIGCLIEEDLINESRFASAFANDKFQFNKWGILRIKNALKAKGVSERNISDSLKRIDPVSYEKELKALVFKKLTSIKAPNEINKKQKIAKYFIGRGYEPSLVWKILQIKDEYED